jgi:hypothetical protein
MPSNAKGKGKSKKPEGSTIKGANQKKGKSNFKKGPSKSFPKRGSTSTEDQLIKGRKEDDVYEYDGDETSEQKKRDELRRFAGVDVYDYEQPEDFEDDEEIDEDAAFDDEDYDRFGDVGKAKKDR